MGQNAYCEKGFFVLFVLDREMSVTLKCNYGQ